MESLSRSMRLARAGASVAALILAVIVVFASSRAGASEVRAAGVRKPAFAGTFYPGDKRALTKIIDDCYRTVDTKDRLSSPPLGILVPHAGYQYSGRVAAHSYSQVRGRSYKTVILLGSSHRAHFKGIATDTATAWETPLGRVSLNQETGRTLASKCPFVTFNPAAFREEHTLEVQLPFLQNALKDFTIVPLLTGLLDEEAYRSLSSTLASLLRDKEGEILVVVSSDLSHYHPYGQAGEMDQRALSDVESLNIDRLMEDLRMGKCELCGAGAVLAFMSAARNLDAKGRLLRYENSGDSTNDRTRVVGYGSVVFTWQGRGKPLGKAQQALLLDIARKAMEASASGKPLPSIAPDDPRLSEPRGVFVTLTRNGALRDCVGYIKPTRPLYRAVTEMAVAASQEDTRFRPVSRGEFREIRIEISVLSPLTPLADSRDIKVGTHGLLIARGGFSGLLLPQVAVEHKWTREEFLRNTCIKAGLPPDAWKERGTAIYTFTAEIFRE